MQALRPKRFPANARVNGVGEVEIGVARHRVNVYVEPCDRANSVAISALVMPTLTRYLPRACTQVRSWEHLHGLTLADPQPSSPMPIGLIIGADYYGALLRPGLRQGPPCSPTAQATLFGWILSGPASTTGSPDDVAIHNCIISDDLPAALTRFWEIEELPPVSRLSEDEAKCEAHFASTHRRAEDGRYIVRLPFKEGPPISIGESFFRAKSMLNTVDRRLQRDSSLKAEYHAFLSEYEALGHMRAAPISAGNETVSPCVYLPHHPVVRQSSSTTRVRVVFNASSATTNSTSLNDHLLVGPKLQTDITTIITRWRSHRFVYTADIAKMFRQILVDPRDVDYQRILWRREGEKTVTPFQLLTVTYGTASAPYLANRVLRQLADDEGHDLPLAKPVLQNNFYVDDALFGADSIEDARKTRNELNQLLSRGGLHLRKWAANVEELLTDCSREDHELATEIPLKEIDAIDVLGIAWNPNRDAFQFRFAPVYPPRLTKRVILSIIARLFDPLGWASPVVIYAKIVLQELWIRKIEWDVELPDDLAERWQNYYSQLEHLPKVFIPRWTGQTSDNKAYEIHGFADASSRAYVAVVYLRVLRDLDDAQVTLLIAKTKVAPVNPVSIPRLELCAAVLLARTLRKVIEDLSLADTPLYAWSDSAVTLHWLQKHPSTWQTFVANRVAEILVLVPKATWRHVPTKDNPADCASRGMLPLEAIEHALWWNGPPWLKRHSTSWPSTRAHASHLADLEERKPTNVHIVQTLENPEWDLPASISSWPRLLRVTAYCLRFSARARSHRQSNERAQRELSSGPVNLKACEVRSASEFWVKHIQKIHFEPELAALQQGRSVASNSRIRRLNPFPDGQGMLRVGGRLANAPIAYDEQHPIILPRHRISELIVRQTHARALHGGARLTLKILRQNFWIVKDNTLVKRIVRECVHCVRERAARPAQLMGDLPAARVSADSPPFSHSGVDYAGPITVRLAKGRGHKTQKAYVALFICFATRAVHLELVSDYATSGFLAAFRRFVARRGIPAAMYSDNGTNFVGADKELRSALRTVARDEDLRAQLVSDGTEWHFNPPAAPHFGGLWEAGVKSVKHHLRRIVGSHTLTFEELATLLTQIEACLNSRPIGPLSNDPDDLTCLTPGHFLIGRPLVAIPEPSVLSINENRLSRWQLVQQKVETFWRRWAAEYLHSVQQRNKWTTSQPNLRIGDLVLLRSQLSPPSKWQLGRIIDCHPGKDTLVRVVTVKTATSVLKRPIAQLCLLPVRDSTTTSD